MTPISITTTTRRLVAYSPVPYRRSWARLLAAPLVLASNVAVGAAVYLPWRTARVRWAIPLDDVMRPVAGSGRSVIYYSWHAYEPFLVLAFRDIPLRSTPSAIGNDGIASRLVQHTVAWSGMPVWVYRRRSPVPPTEQVIQLLKRHPQQIALVPDAGGPYGRVKPGLAEIARAVDAWLIPIVVRGRGRLKIQRPWRYGFPTPFCTVTVYPGEPFEGGTATVDRCQRALEELDSGVGHG